MRIIYKTAFYGGHLTIDRYDGNPVVAKWETLYGIKNDMVGPDVCMVEVYPPVDSLINEIDRRHLFVVDPEVLIKVGAWLRR